jgi:hypothetical protein
MQSRFKLTLAGLVALLVAGFVFSTSALAGPGPFWYQKKVGSSGSGIKISERSPETFTAKSGKSTLIGLAGGSNPEVVCAEDKSTGVIYNNSLQGQGKIAVSFEKCKTNLPECEVNEPIQFKSNLHLAWKYQGKEEELGKGKQLKQQALGQVPDLLFYTGEIKQGTKSLEELKFVELSFKKNGKGTCGQVGIPLTAKGYESATITPEGIEHFSPTASIGFTPGPHEQHFWNGEEQIPLTTKLKLAENNATFESQDEISSYLTQQGASQEVAIFEN